MAKKTLSSSQASSQNSHAHKTLPDPTQTTLSSQSQPLQIQPLPTSNSLRPDRSKKPTPLTIAESSKRTQRICFTPDNVLLILKSLSDFKSKTGKDPVKHLTDFHDSLKSSLKIKTTERKLGEKIRVLRIKFEKQRQYNQVEGKEKSPKMDNATKKLMLEEPPKKENATKKPSISKKSRHAA
ncbi:unnamed protein product [Vicia faba]|uniref:Glabrous enhancer-binding protein-like DBD domain-containing protein n=1 Tax=Vicia faba TaxID=3906 RepID=A0AAV1A6W0_VICFA|nr:unnamed protein product [Vicia faba]